ARRLALIGAVGAGAGPLGATAQGADKAPVFLAGAASADITPPPWTAASDAAFVPACGPTADAVSTLWPGERRYQFEEPYVNGFGPDVHRFAPGDSVYGAREENGRDDRRGAPEGTPQKGGASTPLAAPGSCAAAAMITRTAS